MPQLLIATHNTHKTKEIAEMLGDSYEVRDLTAFPDIPPAIEDGDTFEANASIKAVEASRVVPGLVLSDDSGLEVDALNKEPGIYSARYAGEGATDADNRNKVIAQLESLHLAQPSTARFRCVMALAENGKVIATFDGAIEGTLVTTESGKEGFGYDPLFIPEGHTETFGVLPSELKNSISHRSRALAKVIAYFSR
jgi:XTP/dITP diphosphohydrolase